MNLNIYKRKYYSKKFNDKLWFEKKKKMKEMHHTKQNKREKFSHIFYALWVLYPSFNFVSFSRQMECRTEGIPNGTCALSQEFRGETLFKSYLSKHLSFQCLYILLNNNSERLFITERSQGKLILVKLLIAARIWLVLL